METTLKQNLRVFDQEWISKVVQKSGQTGVPQIWIDDKVIVGFNVSEINLALGL